MESTSLDAGTGYGRPAAQHDARLTEVGPGTPMGEALRRYWHPIASSEALTSDVPHRTRILGEDLIVFRDRQGRPGVVFERCAHRGSSLFYGRVEEDGIRCCYHGWKFDVQGNCLDQACEPGGGKRREVARQPWYPVEERYGLVFVYMGPPDRKPDLPRYEALENLGEGEQYFATIPAPGAEVVGMETDCNWLQTFENAIDPLHAAWLHSQHSGFQFDGVGGEGFPESFFDPKTAVVKYEKTPRGAKYIQSFDYTGSDGSAAQLDWVVEVVLPNIIALPPFVKMVPDQRHDCIIWTVPVDDTHHKAFISVRATEIDRLLGIILGIKQNGKLVFELTEDEKQRYPADFEAQVSQGPITLHSVETLATSDKGVVMLRRMLRQMVDDVEAGRDPLNVTRGDGTVQPVDSGLFTRSVVRADPGTSDAAAASAATIS